MKMLVMAAERNRHLQEEQLENYSMGVISEEELPQFEEHLLICEDCQRRLAETQAYVSAMQAATAQLPAEQTPSRRPWVFPRFAPILAAAVVVLALAVGLRVLQRDTLPPVAVTLAATRGPALATAPAGRPLLLLPDLEGLPVLSSYRLEVVDHAGNRVFQAVVETGRGKGAVAAPKTRAGLYFIRVSTPAGTLLREYGLQVEAGR